MLARATLTCLALHSFVAVILAGPAAPEPAADLAAQYAEWRSCYASLAVDKDSKTLNEGPRRLRCSPDGKALLVAGPGNELTLLNSESLEIVHSVKGHTKPLCDAVFSPDGKMVLSASEDCAARLWDTETGKELAVLSGHTDAVKALAFSPDGTQCLTGSLDKTVRRWDVKTHEQTGKFTNELPHWGGEEKREAGGILSVAWSPDGSRILVGSDAGERQTLLAGKQLNSIGSGWSSNKSRFTRWMFTANNSHHVYIEESDYKGETSNYVSVTAFGVGTSSAYLQDAPNPIDLAGDRSGRFIAVVSRDVIGLYELDIKPPKHDQGFTTKDSLKPFATLKLKGRSFVSAAFAPDGRFFTLASDGSVQIWRGKDAPQPWKNVRLLPRSKRDLDNEPEDKQADAETLADAAFKDGIAAFKSMRLAKISTVRDPRARSIEFSPDGKALLCANGNDALLLNAETLEVLLTFKGHTGRVNAAKFSSDGRFVATGSADKTAILFDSKTGKAIRTFKGHEQEVGVVAFSPDDKKLATGSGSQVGLFSIDSDKALCWGKLEYAGWRGEDSRKGTVLSLAWSTDKSVHVVGTNGLATTVSENGDDEGLTRYSEDINVFFTAYADGGTLRIHGTDNGTIQIRGLVDEDHRYGRIEGPFEINAAAISADGKFLALLTDKHGPRIYPVRVPKGEPGPGGGWRNTMLGYAAELELPKKASLVAVAISSDLKSIAAIDVNGAIYRWAAK